MKIYKGDMVKVSLTRKQLEEKKYVDPETVFYVEKYQGRVGQVFDVTTTSSGFTVFHVNFGKDIGMFYQEEVTLVEENRFIK